MRVTVISALSAGGLMLAVAPQAHALVDFNAPTYTISDVFDTQNVFPRLSGQDNWSSALNNFNEERDAVVSNASLAAEIGGPNIALIPPIDGYAAGNVGTGGVVFDARPSTPGFVPVVNGNSLVADFLSHDFDNDGSNNSAIRLFGWIDKDNDGGLSPADIDAELAIGFGLDDTGQFALRQTRTNGASFLEIQSGVNYVPDKWYTITFSWSDPLPDMSRNVTMHVFNKTDNTDLGNIFDNYNVAETFFGPDPSTWTGIGVRWTEGLMDNILEGVIGGIEGDLNGDGFVGIADLNIVLGAWNQNVTQGDPLAGDPSDDGFVGIADLNIVLGNWNAGTPPAGNTVPEPATLALLGLGGAALLRRR
ncbi:MAG: PEP-CTERM sorting domain-containing protein [Phycisphaerales bacterium]